jgi:magnesium-transporting ATPase (P-type)
VAANAGVDPERGLTEAEARARLASHGSNVLKETKARGALSILLAQLRNPPSPT